MTEQVQRFCDKYFETLNGAESARYAGFSEKTARVQASQMLDNPEVQEYLQKLRAKLSEKTQITQERVLQEIAKIAFSDIRNFYEDNGELKNIKDLNDNDAAALASVKTYEEKEPYTGVVIGLNREIKTHNKLEGLEKLARHLGMYREDNNQKNMVFALMQIDPLSSNDATSTDDSTQEDSGA